MTKPYQDLLKEENPKAYIRWLRDNEGYSFARIGRELWPNLSRSGQRGKANKWYKYASEADYAVTFESEKVADRAREDIKRTRMFKADIPKRIWYSRTQLGAEHTWARTNTPKADIVAYFDIEEGEGDDDYNRVYDYCSDFELKTAFFTRRFKKTEVTKDYREGITIIQTDKRNNTHHYLWNKRDEVFTGRQASLTRWTSGYTL